MDRDRIKTDEQNVARERPSSSVLKGKSITAAP